MQRIHRTAARTIGAPARAAVRLPRRLAGRLPRSLLLAALLTGLLAGLLPAVADARQYRDVKSSHWAKRYIDEVTSKVIDGRRLMHDYGASFKPGKAITRAHLARLLVALAGKHGTAYAARELPDVTADHCYYDDIQLALKYGLMGLQGGEFKPDAAVLLWQLDRSLVLVTKMRNPRADWTMLTTLSSAKWQPNPGWFPSPPSYFATEVAARWLEYRYNHHGQADALELSVIDPARRADVAYSVYKLLNVSAWRLQGLRNFNRITFPTLSARQRQIAAFAFKWVGYPHIYGGEFPTKDSPYGYQLHGGFDCSGFTWWIMKISFKYSMPLGGRSAAQMAAAKPRITRAKLQPLDLLYWASGGAKASAASVYHAGLYLGNGWFIHSTGSTGGVSLASLDWTDWAWKKDFAWGGRLLKKSELGTYVTPSASPSVVPTPSPSPSPASPPASP